jgi:hypothetical protein
VKVGLISTLGKEMDRKNLIHRATDYFGVAYYGFLAMYALYEMFFGQENISLIVIAPLSYTLFVMGGIELLLAPLSVIVGLIKIDIDLLINRSISNFFMGIFIIAGALLLFSVYAAPEDAVNLVIVPESWVFALIAIVEILLRRLVFQTTVDPKKKGLNHRVRQASCSYMPGIISIFVLVAGFYYLHLFDGLLRSTNITSKVVLIFILFFIPGFFLLEIINFWLADTFPRGSSTSVLKTSTQNKENKDVKRFWPWYLSIFFSLPLSVLGSFLLTHLAQWLPDKQLFILVIAFNYALLALSRWGEINDLEKQDREVLK